jgi:hypothetical protein
MTFGSVDATTSRPVPLPTASRNTGSSTWSGCRAAGGRRPCTPRSTPHQAQLPRRGNRPAAASSISTRNEPEPSVASEVRIRSSDLVEQRRQRDRRRPGGRQSDAGTVRRGCADVGLPRLPLMGGRHHGALRAGQRHAPRARSTGDVVGTGSRRHLCPGFRSRAVPRPQGRARSSWSPWRVDPRLPHRGRDVGLVGGDAARVRPRSGRTDRADVVSRRRAVAVAAGACTRCDVAVCGGTERGQLWWRRGGADADRRRLARHAHANDHRLDVREQRWCADRQPVAVCGGAYARDRDGAPAFFDGTAWTSRGGSLD